MIIVDSNIIFSALLSSNLHFSAILLDDNKNTFASPSFLFVEIFKHKEKLIRYSKLSQNELLDLLNSILSNIQFISHKILSKTSIDYAYDLCKDVAHKDTIFVAMAIEFNSAMDWGQKTH